MDHSSTLQTRNVFIDTQAFTNEHFRFDHPKLKKLAELGKSKMISIYSTDTVVGEVKSKLSEKMAKAAKALSDFRSEAGFLESGAPADVSPLFSPPTEQALTEKAHSIWNEFLTTANVTIFDSSSIRVSTLLESYFLGTAPFGTGKKKSEFPDAISTLSIEHWAEKTGDKLYVVSGDADFKKWSENHPCTILLNGIGDFLDIYNRTEEKLTELVERLYKEDEEWIASVIKDKFLECGFLYSDDYDAEVTDVDIDIFDVLAVNIIEVDEESASLSIRVRIGFAATISGHDYNNGIWDSEDHQYIYLPTFNEEMTFSECYDVSLKVIFNSENDEIYEIDKVMFDDGTDISLSNNDGYPYK